MFWIPEATASSCEGLAWRPHVRYEDLSRGMTGGTFSQFLMPQIFDWIVLHEIQEDGAGD